LDFYNENWLLAQNAGTTGYIDVGNNTSAFPMNDFDVLELEIKFSERIAAVEPDERR